MSQAIEVPRAIVIQVATWYEEELVLETVCRDYDHYVSLPDVVTYQDRLTGNKPVECGKTGWSSDRNYACYKSGACIAHGGLLGKRVLLKDGMRGQVVAVGLEGAIEIANELEDNEYRYWCNQSEIQERL